MSDGGSGGINPSTAFIVLVVVVALVFAYWQYQEAERQRRQRTLGGGIGQLGGAIGTIVDSVYVGGAS